MKKSERIKIVKKAVCEVLNIREEYVTESSDIFQLGFHSLLLFRLTSVLKQHDLEISFATIFRESTIEGIASNVTELMKSVAEFNPLSLYFDAGEFSNEEITEVLSLLSSVYSDIGGDSLVIRGKGLYNYSKVLNPTH